MAVSHDVPPHYHASASSPCVCLVLDWISTTIVASFDQDTIAVPPNLFGIDPEDALEAEVNQKYANRVVLDVGLAICVFDFLKISEGVVRYGDGAYWYKGMTPPWPTLYVTNPMLLFWMVNYI